MYSNSTKRHGVEQRAHGEALAFGRLFIRDGRLDHNSVAHNKHRVRRSLSARQTATSQLVISVVCASDARFGVLLSQEASRRRTDAFASRYRRE